MSDDRLPKPTRSPHRKRVVTEWPTYWLMDKPQEYPWIGVRMRRVTLRKSKETALKVNEHDYYDI